MNLLSSSGLDSEDTALDVKKGDIESSSTEIVDENVALIVGLSGTETVGDSGGGRLVDDTENVEASNGTSVLGGLPLVVVEVGGDGDDGLLDLLAELGLGNLLHLDEDHGGDFLGRESLGLVEVFDLDLGGSIVIDDLERPGLDVLLDGGVIESAADKTPEIVVRQCSSVRSFAVSTHLTSKTVLMGFMAAWFLAASPIRRSSAVKETKDGVVKEPWSLATGRWHCQRWLARVGNTVVHTDLNAIALVVGNARVGGA